MIDWPTHVEKPRVGLVQDYGEHIRWTKYRRLLDRNSFPYGIYNIHAHDWIENAGEYDVIVGLPSAGSYHLEEIRRKYYVLETYLGKTCYPSRDHAILYEDKSLEAEISKAAGIPYANTYVAHDKQDALRLIETLTYPVVSKIVPASGSVGMELVRTPDRSRKIVEQAFSRNGRKTHVAYFRQKNYVYFQDYVPNDGYDIRIIVIGNWVFGCYRKVLEGDFRASGMGLIEKRALPERAMRIALQVNTVIKSPFLAVDMVHGLDDRYCVIEFSPICRGAAQLEVDGVPGVYVLQNDGSFRFERGKYWTHELALREFLLKHYLPKISPEKAGDSPGIGAIRNA